MNMKMKRNSSLRLLGGLATATISLVAGAAQAASLEGGVSFGPTVGFGNGLTFIGTGLFAPDGVTPLTDFDFQLPAQGNVGIIVETNAGTPPPLDFVPFIGDSVTIKDLQVIGSPNPPNGTTFPPFPITDFILNPGKFSIDILSVSFPTYSEQNGNTTVSVGVTAVATNLADGMKSFGSGNFSADFSNSDIPQTRAKFDEPGEKFGPNSWSATFEFAEQPVPEPSTNIGLAMLLGLGVFSLKKRLLIK